MIEATGWAAKELKRVAIEVNGPTSFFFPLSIKKGAMKNPNEYNDQDYGRYSMETDDAIVAMWEAGGSLENIEDVISNALENATGSPIMVTLQPVQG